MAEVHIRPISETKGVPSGWLDHLLPYLLFALPVILTSRLPFFWDTLQLGSRHAQYFYDHNFNSLFLPNDMDSGHIPALGMYLALVWKLFGKTLIVSHLSMLPFVLGAVYFTRQLVDRLFQTRWSGLITCFLLADATILTQFTLVSPDVWIVFFLMMALSASFAKKRFLLAIAALGLALTSMRGMMITVALFTADFLFVVFIREQPDDKKFWIKKAGGYILRSLPVYLPAFLVSVTYMGLHFLRTGWIGYHSGMPWAEHFQRVDATGFLRNVLILGWRLADQGRIFLWITGLVLLILSFRLKWKTDGNGRRLLIFLVVMMLILGYSALTYKNLAGHRYQIPVFLLLSLTVIYHLMKWVGQRKKVLLILVLLILGMVSGNFWVYPDRISKGWDAMLAYLPYQSLRHEMIGFIEQNHIEFSNVGTGFPNNTGMNVIELSGDTRAFGSMEAGMDNFRFIFYSNVYNEFSDDDLTELRTEWKVVKSLHKGQVKMILYENPYWVIPSR